MMPNTVPLVVGLNSVSNFGQGGANGRFMLSLIS
jgi:hypothetical protein